MILHEFFWLDFLQQYVCSLLQFEPVYYIFIDAMCVGGRQQRRPELSTLKYISHSFVESMYLYRRKESGISTSTVLYEEN